MQLEFINIGLAFIEGLALIASPCILPILPIVLASSLEGSRTRPYGVVLGFVFSFALFTLGSRQLVLLFGLDLNLIRNISFAVLMLLAIIMMSSCLTERFNKFTQGLANIGYKLNSHETQTGFFSGLAFGGLIGLIWTPCAGPILAAVIVQTILQQSSFLSLLIILAFAIGAALPMLIIILFSRQIANKTKFLEKNAIAMRKILGLIIFTAVLLMINGVGIFLPANPEKTNAQITSNQLINGLNFPYVAPEITDITAWINSPPLQLAQLTGKVILIDFWAYSCINCVRTLPYLTNWYNKYKGQGLVIIGIHSPEFDFEKELANVQKSVQQHKINYPVGLDNNFTTWRNFSNHYWPAHYLLDKNGKVVYTHFGEGDYAITENNIRFLLGLNQPVDNIQQPVARFVYITPETYLGYSRIGEFFSPEEISRNKPANYTYPPDLSVNAWALSGSWQINAEQIISQQAKARIKLHFNAQQVYAVIGGTTQPTNIQVWLDGVPQPAVSISGHNLYKLLDLPNLSNGVLELETAVPGLEFYTFTFGGE